MLDIQTALSVLEKNLPFKKSEICEEALQTLKTAVLAQQTPNSDYAAALGGVLSSYFGRIPQLTLDNIAVEVQRLNAKHFA